MKQIILLIVATCLLHVAHAEVNKDFRVPESAYRKIVASKGVNVSLMQCDYDSIMVVTDGCPTEDVLTFVKKNVLYVKMKRITKGSAVEVFVKFKDIEELEATGGASIETECLLKRDGKLVLGVGAESDMELELEVDELEVDAHTCDITLTGIAKKQNVVMKGTVGESKYDAGGLKSEDVTIFVSETDAVVNFSNSLSAECNAGVVEYKGPSEKIVKNDSWNGGEIKEYTGTKKKSSIKMFMK